jgi:hypothetical protein
VVPIVLGALLFIGLAFGIAAAFIVRTTDEAPAPRGDVGASPAAGAPAAQAPVVSTPVVQEAPPPPPPPTATFSLHHTAVSVGTNLHVYGVVTNTSEVAVRAPEVHVILTDEQGEDVHADHGYAALDFLEPGQSSPIDVLVDDAPPHAGLRTEVTVRAADWRPTLAAGLVVAPLPPTQQRSSWRFAGEVRNEGDTAAQFVKVRITGWDADDKLVGIAQTYAAGKEGLPAGGSARYSTSHSLWAAPPARFEVEVAGRVP